MAVGTVTFEYSKYSDEQILEVATLELTDGVFLEVSRTPSTDEVEFKIKDTQNDSEVAGYGNLDAIEGFYRGLSQFRRQMSG